MAMLATGTVGAPVSSTGPGVPVAQGVRLLNTNELGGSQVHGRYYEGTYRGGRFSGGWQVVASTAMQSGVTASATGGLTLVNPNGSSVNAVLEKVGFANVLAQTSASVIGIAVGQSTAPVPAAGTPVTITPRSRKVGSGYLPQCSLVTGATLALPVAPTLDTVLCTVDTGVITGFPTFLGNLFDIDGGIILPPGGFLNLYATNGLLISSYFITYQWEEVPI